MFLAVMFCFTLFGGTSHCLNFEKFCDAALFSYDIRGGKRVVLCRLQTSDPFVYSSGSFRHLFLQMYLSG